MREVFFTGFPGFIGRKLIIELLASGARVHCLVQPHMLQRADQEAEDICRSVKKKRKNIDLHPGDITRERMGLDEETYKHLTAATSHVFHLAAVYDLAVPLALAQRINIVGTDYVNRFCLDCAALERYIYFSTCYVSGTHMGLFREQDLELGQDFKNHYESTKHFAEVRVRALMDEIPTTIIRPSIVVGDSKTGETVKFDGPYFIMTFASRFARLPLPYVGKGRAPINLVPLDYLVKGTMVLADKESTVGGTYHLADPRPYPSREVYARIVELIAGKKPSWSLPTGFVSALHRLAVVRKLTGLERETIVYQDHMVHYDTAEAEKELAGSVSCPDLMEILPVLVEYYLAHREEKELYMPARSSVCGGK